MSDVVAKRVVVTGSVQGVFFRDTANRRAEACGVTGWIVNRSDGAVEAHIEGPPGGVEGMLEFLREGPPRAQVTDAEVSDAEPEGLTEFEVR
ncbi:MAG TPA: acylphosphatase [Solirubrobacteraceae bacterium]|jgi:acylphosphatase